MKALYIIFTFLFICSLSGQTITDNFEKRSHSAYGKTLPYRLYIPQNYDPSLDYPLVLTLHGSEERGTDNEQQITEYRIATIWAEDSTQAKYPCFVVSPQCPPDVYWHYQFDVLSDLICLILEEFSIDSTRLYAVGFSMGAIGSWFMTAMMPFRFAAMVPIAGGGASVSETVPLLEYIPAIWNFHAVNDVNVSVSLSRNMIHAIEQTLDTVAFYTDLKDGVPTGNTEADLDSALQSGVKLIYTEYPTGGHYGILDLTFNNARMHQWMFTQSTEFILPQNAISPTTIESFEFIHMSDQSVLSTGNPGSWDDWAVSEPSVISESDTIKMWYVGWESGWRETTRVGYAWSLDGITWNRYNYNPVLSPSLEWEGRRVNKTSVIKDEETYKMWYSVNDKALFSTAIGYAVSTDGITWIKNPQPVLIPGDSDDWDHFNIALGTVIKEGDHYKMWYQGGTGLTGFHIGLAISPDGIIWTKYNDPATQDSPYQNSDPVLMKGCFIKDWDFHSVWSPAVLKSPSGYQMWYSGSNIGIPGFICYAISTDGINWFKSKSNPILYETPPWSLNGSGYYGSSILKYNDRYHLWYSLVNISTGRSRIGYLMDTLTIGHIGYEYVTTKRYSLSQNYPNPFNPSTTIEFSLPHSEFVELKIYNILGKEVATLVSNNLNQGNHTYTFDGNNLASGIYYYQLTAGEYREVKKLILLK